MTEAAIHKNADGVWWEWAAILFAAILFLAGGTLAWWVIFFSLPVVKHPVLLVLVRFDVWILAAVLLWICISEASEFQQRTHYAQAAEVCSYAASAGFSAGSIIAVAWLMLWLAFTLARSAYSAFIWMLA